MHRYIARTATFVALFLGGTALAASPTVNFDIKFSGHVDCESPIELKNVPLAVRGISVLRGDGTGSMDSEMTAYYFLKVKSSIDGKLGGAPVPIQGGTASIQVLNETGLRYITDYPQTQYTVDIVVDGKKCGARLTPKLKGNNKSYEIYAIDAAFKCSRFQVEKSSCRISSRSFAE